MKQTILTPKAEDSGKRADVYIAEQLNISRNAAQMLEAFCENKTVAKNYRIRSGETIVVSIPEPELIDSKPQELPVNIIYEDDYLLVVNKPQGMVVHPAVGNPDGTLVNALMYYCKSRLSSINGKIRPGIVHRIDKDTAGLLIVAKTDESHNALAAQIAEHSFTRRYVAVVYGRLKEDSGTINEPVGRNKNDRKRMVVTNTGSKEAITHYKVLQRYQGYTYVELTLETGRTHQIRVHMLHIGHPVVGDRVYAKGRDMLGLNGQCLFAKHIGFKHPVSDEWLEFEAEIPKFFVDLLHKIEKFKEI
ncbi:MAG: RNA pseudouridine synthase [Clostridiales bacterium GWF2_38_85]|nr:MAG: RNA pseudouridine synthase [Clostridiales bacterium GWF2_38_85]HBL84211.1 RNA pseudouridine synthase [Clostridiales bacterium]